MLATLAGFSAGVNLSAAWGGPTHWVTLATPWTGWPVLAPWLFAVLVLWALDQIGVLWRLARSSPTAPVRQRLLSPRYHLTASAALLALAGGFLYLTQSAWLNSIHLRRGLLYAWTASTAL